MNVIDCFLIEKYFHFWSKTHFFLSVQNTESNAWFFLVGRGDNDVSVPVRLNKLSVALSNEYQPLFKNCSLCRYVFFAWKIIPLCDFELLMILTKSA